MLKKTLMLCLLNCWLVAFAQRIDHTSTFKTIHQKSYFRLHWDNDYFTKTDKYYTQGLTLEYVHPVLKKNPFNKLFFKVQNSDPVSGFSINFFGYTPTSILSDSILDGDRPFAAGNTVRIFSIGTDSVHKMRLTSAISIGVIGPVGLGNEIQSGIHGVLKNPLPHGWQYQIQNDLILNYQVNYEKQVLAIPGRFLLNAVAELMIGTLNDKLSAGVNSMVGHFKDPYKLKESKRIEYYLYVQARNSFIGYDASLQGGLFNRNSVYTIASNQVEHITFQADAGIVVNFKRLYLAYMQSFLSREFNTGKYHRWGGIYIGFTF